MHGQRGDLGLHTATLPWSEERHGGPESWRIYAQLKITLALTYSPLLTNLLLTYSLS